MEELKQTDQRTMKLMTMHKALYPKNDIGLMYQKKEGGRGLANIADYVDVSIHELGNYIKKIEERLITAPSSSNGNPKPDRKTSKPRIQKL